MKYFRKRGPVFLPVTALWLITSLHACGGDSGPVVNAPAASSSAVDCLDPASTLQAGSSLRYTMRLADAGGGLDSTLTVTRSVNGNVDFLDALRTEVVMTEVRPFAPSDRVERRYVARSGDALTTYGVVVTESSSDASGTITVRETTSIYDPPAVLALNVAAGENTFVEWTGTTTAVNVTNGIRTSLEPITSTSTVNYAFVGFEVVTVPAGTYTTCRFVLTTPVSKVVHWYVAGVGVPAQTELYFANEDEPVGLMQATEILVNGAPIQEAR